MTNDLVPVSPAPLESSPPEPAPAARPARRWVRPVVIAGGSVLALGVLLGTGWAIIEAQHSPAAKAEQFLDLLVGGDAEAATLLLESQPGNAMFLTNEIYGSASDRITEFSVGETKLSADLARVTTTITQGGRSYEKEMSLTRFSDGIFTDWRISLSNLVRIDAETGGPGGTTLDINGIRMLSTRIPSVRAFPGTYELTVDHSSEFVQNQAKTLEVRFSGTTALLKVALSAALTEEGEARALQLIQDHLNSCLTRAVLRDPDCPFSVNSVPGETVTDIRWSLKVTPTYSTGRWEPLGFPVRTESPGWVRMDAHYATGSEEGDLWSDNPEVYPEGWVKVNGDGSLVFDSAYS